MSSMRIRQLRPEFWTDDTLAELDDAVRLFYVGLWGIADDAGWLRWNTSRIGALLYPYRDKVTREDQVEAWTAQLERAERIRRLGCGCAVIPTLARHQVIGGRRSEGEKRRHVTEHADRPAVDEGGGGFRDRLLGAGLDPALAGPER